MFKYPSFLTEFQVESHVTIRNLFTTESQAGVISIN